MMLSIDTNHTTFGLMETGKLDLTTGTAKNSSLGFIMKGEPRQMFLCHFLIT